MLKEIKKGFTLAEVLIVIGIIGVVAALTLPNLNHATGDKEKVTKVKKIYSTLTEAVDRAQAIYGPFDTWFKDLADNAYSARTERFAKRVTEFLKVSKDCGFNEGCFSSVPLIEADGNTFVEDSLLDWFNEDYMVTLSDGMSVAFWFKAESFEANGGNKVTVDIDGPNKGKNQWGSDIFEFSIYSDEDSANNSNMNINQLYPSDSQSSWTGTGIDAFEYSTAWVIENGNLDYLKCPDELNWETKTSCE